MFKILIWGIGEGYNRCVNLIKYYEATGEITVVGVTSDDVDIYKHIDGYPFFSKRDVTSIVFDYCIVTIDNWRAILSEAEELGIEKRKIILARVLSVPYFSFEKYIDFKENGISIISSNCWGGLCYHYLALEFQSPTINMYFSSSEFNRFISNLDYYLLAQLKYERTEYHSGLQHDFPVGKLDDISIFFLHYPNFECAEEAWERRKNRMVDNKLYISCTEIKDVAEEFCSLPIQNKYIFVPNEIKIIDDSVIRVHYNDCEGRNFGQYINRVANGRSPIISPFLLCSNAQFRRTDH
ncbi:DUF1919 domain-containing protein [Butyrivibrio fibrisolvens]|uniref:DUF1919 domain-containing protein n=1 Tax=Butyrivibrio fibrisolvens TaxID=831 RepID=UPI0003B47A15|nr:DUF1919 domain-containing protein [Butyrivibrio fibrisolvens]